MIYKIPKLIRFFYPNYVWNIPTSDKVLYITFDDGPIPEITEWVLDELAKFNAKATFFCIGDNVAKHPQIFKKIIDGGHKVGNHTFNHYDGWKVSNLKYVENVKKCNDLINSNLLRPPYGRIKKMQYNLLKNDYKIVMWSILTWDFMKNLDQNYSIKKITTSTKRGDIIVFHDSLKAEENLKFLLPLYLKYFSEKEFKFEVLPL